MEAGIGAHTSYITTHTLMRKLHKQKLDLRDEAEGIH